MEISSTIPIFRIFDKEKALEFYEGWLGFKVMWEHRYGDDFPVYIEVALGHLTLHLSEHHGDCSPGAKVFVNCKGLTAYNKILIDKKYKYNRPGVEKAPWGDALIMEVTDPFGNKILFCESNE